MAPVMITVQIGFNVFTFAFELNQSAHCSNWLPPSLVALVWSVDVDDRILRKRVELFGRCGDLSTEPTLVAGKFGKFDTHEFPRSAKVLAR